MTVDESPRQRTGGRAGRQAARARTHIAREPFLTRALEPFEVLNDEGLSIIEANADTILEQVGLEFRGDADALRLFREAGADVQGERVRFPRGMCRQIVQATAPRQSRRSRATPRTPCTWAAWRPCSRQPTARRSSATSTVDAATGPSRTSATS